MNKVHLCQSLPLPISIYNSTHLNLSSSLALVKGQLASSKSLRTFQTTLLSEYLENTSLDSHLIGTTSCGIVRRCRPVLWPLLPQVAPVLQQDLNVPELTPCSWLLFVSLVSTYFLFRSGFYFFASSWRWLAWCLRVIQVLQQRDALDSVLFKKKLLAQCHIC